MYIVLAPHRFPADDKAGPFHHGLFEAVVQIALPPPVQGASPILNCCSRHTQRKPLLSSDHSSLRSDQRHHIQNRERCPIPSRLCPEDRSPRTLQPLTRCPSHPSTCFPQAPLRW